MFIDNLASTVSQHGAYLSCWCRFTMLYHAFKGAPTACIWGLIQVEFVTQMLRCKA